MSEALSAPDLARNFGLIVRDLRALLAARMSRPKTAEQLAAFPLMMLLWHRH